MSAVGSRITSDSASSPPSGCDLLVDTSLVFVADDGARLMCIIAAPSRKTARSVSACPLGCTNV